MRLAVSDFSSPPSLLRTLTWLTLLASLTWMRNCSVEVFFSVLLNGLIFARKPFEGVLLLSASGST